MKANVFLTLISILLSTLFGYLVYNVASVDENDVICGIASGVCFAATLVPVIGLQYASGRLGVNIRVFSSIFCIVFIISHFCFAIFGVIMPYYLIVNGVLLLIYLAIFYKFQGIRNL